MSEDFTKSPEFTQDIDECDILMPDPNPEPIPPKIWSLGLDPVSISIYLMMSCYHYMGRYHFSLDFIARKLKMKESDVKLFVDNLCCDNEKFDGPLISKSEYYNKSGEFVKEEYTLYLAYFEDMD